MAISTETGFQKSKYAYGALN